MYKVIMLKNIEGCVRSFSDEEKAKTVRKFLQTQKGGYGEGDIILGVTVPKCREIAKKYFRKVNLDDLGKLIKSKYHEERLLVLLILIEKYKGTKNKSKKKQIFEFYLDNTNYINNWDLVDLSSHRILGEYIFEEVQDYEILLKLAKSKNIWEKRIAIVSTIYFVRKGHLETTFTIAEILLTAKEDIIQKAVGWLLKEAGKQNETALENFLKNHSSTIPKKVFRFTTEKFDMNKKENLRRVIYK